MVGYLVNNPNAEFIQAGPGVFTTNGRNTLKLPGINNFDASVFKNFSFTESVKVRVTADFFNAFNHPNDVNPNSSTGLQDLSQQVNAPRIIQFSLRLSF